MREKFNTLAQKHPKKYRESDLKNRLYKMTVNAKPEIRWQAESLLQRWKRKRLEKQLTKEIRVRLAYHWQHYDKLDTFQRQALDDYITTQERKIRIEDLLWEQGYRHGDHVLVYKPNDGSFTQKVLTKFEDEGMFVGITPGELPKWEHSRNVKPEDRTKRESQPDLASHETSWLIKVR